MWQSIRSLDVAVKGVLVAAALSFLFWGWVWWFDFHEPPISPPENYRTYDELHNWWPYPFFFLVIAPAVSLTWRPFLRVWLHLARTGVMTGKEKGAVAKTVAAVQRKTIRWRYGAVALSILIACLLNWWDLKPKIEAYFLSQTYQQQLVEGCKENSVFAKWLFEKTNDNITVISEASLCSSDTNKRSGRPHINAPLPQRLFMFAGYLQQFLISFFAVLLLLQILLHTLIFSCFERLKFAREYRVNLNLNCNSPLNEFGLEHWNYALNNLYWALSPPMLIVFLSRAATDPGNYGAGQRFLGIAVPLILLLPIIATIIVRQARLPQVWSTLKPKGPVSREDYLRQQLWPLDRNWASKLGIVLAFALAAIALGFEISQLMSIQSL